LTLFVAIFRRSIPGGIGRRGGKSNYSLHTISISHGPPAFVEGVANTYSKVQTAFWRSYRLGQFVPPQPTFPDSYTSAKETALSEMAASAGATAITLEVISSLFNFYRRNFSVVGRVERLEEDAEETTKMHDELQNVHLPNLPEDCEEIDRDLVYDREAEIAK
jgi:hypothetical protein